jgi:hypothetical protein
MQNPEIVEDFIKQHGAAEEHEGTIRTEWPPPTTMAMDITPNHPVVRSYLEYKPKSADLRYSAVEKAGSRAGV